MNRNSMQMFSQNPVNIDMSRSTFHRNASVKTSFNIGNIVPFFVEEVLPGDTFNINTSLVARLQTMLTPVMDNIYLDKYYFFVPNRLVWEHWKNFNGENTASAWIPGTTYQVPQITSPVGGWNVGTIADYMGIPTGVAGLSVNALPFRAYAMIINEWFRDQNLQSPLNIPVTDTTVVGVNTGTFVTDVAKGGLPYIASKYRDYFTSCLPAPQKGPDVGIALSGNVPVYGTNGSKLNYIINSANTFVGALESQAGSTTALISTSNGTRTSNQLGLLSKEWKAANPALASTFPDSGAYADLSGVSMISINALRTAFAIQKMYEKDARGGSRYIEIIKAHFGVTSPDSRMQRPEYLGGNRTPLNVNQVIQMSSNSGADLLGDQAAYSLTSDYNSDFTKSFTEHGFVIGLMVARYDHTYQQGVERFWSRKDRFDYYWPSFANIGEQAIKNKEIYAQGNATDDQVFGYQEAWADYRYKANRVTGEMRSTYATTLDVWHLGDKYTSLPTLSDAWIREDKTNVDRCLAVKSAVSNQLFADILISNKATRPLPMYSIPGLIDHH